MCAWVGPPAADGAVMATKTITRQPVFDADLAVVGYTLEYREPVDEIVVSLDPDGGSSIDLDARRLGGTVKAFVDVGAGNLDRVRFLDRDLIGVSIPPDLVPDESVVAACRSLWREGFEIVLVDLRPGDERASLLPFAAGAQIDVSATFAEVEAVLDLTDGTGVDLIAVNVDDGPALEFAKSLGCTRFLGRFFTAAATPSSGLAPATADRLAALRQVVSPDSSIESIEDVVRRDPIVTHKLLRYINSVVFAWRRDIDSVHDALVLLGEREMRRWLTVVVLRELAQGRPTEIAVASVVRARMCEVLAEMVGRPERSGDLFLTGVLSHLEALTGVPLADALEGARLSPDVAAALLGGGRGSSLPARALTLVLAYEDAAWAEAAAACEALGIEMEDAATAYLEGVDFGHDLSGV